MTGEAKTKLGKSDIITLKGKMWEYFDKTVKGRINFGQVYMYSNKDSGSREKHQYLPNRKGSIYLLD